MPRINHGTSAAELYCNRIRRDFSYRYDIHHTHIALKGKILANIEQIIQPYASGSLGVGFNHAHGFSSTPKLFEQLPAPGFQSNTVTSFIFTIGVGVQKTLNDHWSAGLGYEFADWGQTQLSRSAGQTLNNGLSLSNLYVNGLLFNISYTA